MKKVLFIFLILILSGCSKYEVLTCTYTTDEKVGTTSVVVTYQLDSKGRIASSNKVETMIFKDADAAEKFYRLNVGNAIKIDDTKVEYTETKNYDEKVEYENIKSAMEANNYVCELK